MVLTTSPPAGAGKSTTLGVLTGFLEPTEGASAMVQLMVPASLNALWTAGGRLPLLCRAGRRLLPSSPGRPCPSLPPAASTGTAIIEGHDIRQDMPAIYSLMGVCPQVRQLSIAPL